MTQSTSGVPGFSLDDAVRQMEELEGLEHVSEPYIRFRTDLLKTQRAAIDGLVPQAPSTAGNGRNAEPPLTATNVVFDQARLSAMVVALRDLLGCADHSEQDVPRLCRSLADDPEQALELASRSAFLLAPEELESLSERLDAGLDALVFTGRVLAAPFVHAAAVRRPDYREAVFRLGRCGICSAEPGLGLLEREGGRRVLFCSLCGGSGRSKRLVCPFCGHSDVGALSYVRVDESDPRWIESCDKCGRYLKVVDERKIPAGRPFIPAVEDAATLHLDMLAEREGSRRNLPYAACV